MDNLTQHMETITVIDIPSDKPDPTIIVDKLIREMEEIHIRSDSRNSTDASIHKLPLVGLEVMQYYATDYFDDEDFVYQEFTLPSCVIESINQYSLDVNYNNSISNSNSNLEPYHARVSRYLINKYMGLDNSICSLPMQNILRNIIILYENIIQYAAITDEYGYESVTCECIHEIINSENNESDNFEHIIYQTTQAILQHINLNPHSDAYNNMARYSQETLYGLGIILYQIQCIMDAYANLDIHKIADGYSQAHIQRLFRLVNNMCVIILFFFLIHEDMLDDTYAIDANNKIDEKYKIGGGIGN